MSGARTLREIAELWARALDRDLEEPSWLIGDFLDDFRLRAGSDEERMRLVQDEPAWVEAGPGEPLNAYLAAIAESVCIEAGLPVPAWTCSPCRFLEVPWFAGGLESLKATLLVESPVPFRRRNLFVSANALSRA